MNSGTGCCPHALRPLRTSDLRCRLQHFAAHSVNGFEAFDRDQAGCRNRLSLYPYAKDLGEDVNRSGGVSIFPQRVSPAHVAGVANANTSASSGICRPLSVYVAKVVTVPVNIIVVGVILNMPQSPRWYADS